MADITDVNLALKLSWWWDLDTRVSKPFSTR